MQRAEDFRDLQRRIVRQHDTAGTDADALGGRGGAGDQDFRRGAGQQVHRMVLGVPQPCVAQPVHMLRQVKRVGESLRG